MSLQREIVSESHWDLTPAGVVCLIVEWPAVPHHRSSGTVENRQRGWLRSRGSGEILLSNVRFSPDDYPGQKNDDDLIIIFTEIILLRNK